MRSLHTLSPFRIRTAQFPAVLRLFTHDSAHVHHTWQRAHSSRLRFPHPGSGPCGFGQVCPTCAPPPGGRQVHGPCPRLAGREGAIITRPEGPPPPHAFHPGHARPGSRRSLPPPARSLTRVGGGPGVQRPGGNARGRRGSEVTPPRPHGDAEGGAFSPRGGGPRGKVVPRGPEGRRGGRPRRSDL